MWNASRRSSRSKRQGERRAGRATVIAAKAARRFHGRFRAVSEENPSAGPARCKMLLSAGDHTVVIPPARNLSSAVDRGGSRRRYTVRWLRWLLVAAAAVVVLAVGGTFVYIHFIEGPA